MFHVFEAGQFNYVDARHGFGLSPDFVEQVAQVHYGERTERDGRLMYRFPSRDDASNFVHNIGILNERYTNVLRDSLIEKMRNAGISVSTDWQEGERVLAQENGKSISNFRLMGDFFEKVYFEETSARFNKDLRLIYEEGKNNFQLHCGRPSTLLFNYGIPDREIVLYANKLLSKAKEHGYKIEDVNSLPMSLAYPMAIFNGSYVGSFAILTELDINGRKSIVSIDINKGIIQDVNLITSIYDMNCNKENEYG